ncbi:ADP-ribosylglycohydrolase family protein [Saccharopolyspora dendranthemae]|uniref:ADP-ribosylglycohydrolase family protein n=1 Tax=Saccharopolyspora dendranthemae TaxID=1181886 RepID=UPI0011A20F7F|nr:ADP-ribosylglycohydrolase family protein [Saccharopolyspora dendranthemae]
MTEPEGELRMANTTPYPGFSLPLSWPGEPARSESIDPEYVATGLYGMGVPKTQVTGWEITHPDGSVEEKTNPDYRPGPLRQGLPQHENKLEALLNYLAFKYLPRQRVLFGLLGSEFLVPGDADAPPEPRLVMRVYTSPRHIPEMTSWWRMTGLTFLARYPGASMAINPDSYPSFTIKSDELNDLQQHLSRLKPGEPVYEEEFGLTPENARSAALQQRFGLEQPPSINSRWFVQARASGHELTQDEREKLLLGVSWLRYNSGRRRAGEPEEWPEDLNVNGLVITHDARGRAEPHFDTFGKFARVGAFDPHRSWHRTIGAYVGFAVGETLGAAVDGMTWPQIQQRYGRAGIQEPDVVFARPGQVGWLTQLLMFLTEGTMRGLEGTTSAVDPAAVRSAHARWLVTQGVQWQQAAGPLAAEHPQPDGWLLGVPELHANRGASPQLIEAVRAAVADPSQSSLGGPLLLMWALPGAVSEAGSALAGGWNRTEIDDAASNALAALFQRLFLEGDFVNPIWLQLQQLLKAELTGTRPGTDQVAAVVRDVDQRRTRYFDHDIELIERTGTGTDTLSVLGRALMAASRREYKPEMALRIAVNHSGSSALTGALTGAIIGARTGVAGLPRQWVEALDVRDLLLELAEDAFWHFAHRNVLAVEGDDDWTERYPRW